MQGCETLLIKYNQTQNLRSDVLRQPFPDKDDDKDGPEESDALLLHEDTLSPMQRIEQLNSRKQVWKDHVRRINQE